VSAELLRSLCLAGAVAAGAANIAWGTVIVETSGAVDPLENGFLRGTNGLPGFVQTPQSDTEDHWYYSIPPGGSGIFYKNLDAANLQDPSGWTATVRVRSEATGDNPQNTHFQVSDATDSWIISLLDHGPQGPGSYVWNQNYLAGARISSALPIEYHTYQMIFDPAGNGGSGLVHFWVDGFNTGVQQTRNDVSPDGQNRFIMGGNTVGGSVPYESRWSLARLETGQHPIMASTTPGDFNLDGYVDAADYTIWRDNLGGSRQEPEYTDWITHFGAHPGSGSGGLASITVPEPSTGVLMLLAMAAGIVCQRKRRRLGS
jgi:PEP-CTERM motif